MNSNLEIDIPYNLSFKEFEGIARIVGNHNQYSNVVECGVFQGYSSLRLRRAFSDKYSIWGFDSFEGLPEDWVGAPSHCKRGCFTTGGIVPTVEGVTFVKGWFEDTLPKFCIEHPEGLALLFIDCDLYTSTLQVLNSLNSLIREGTVIVFDEYYYNGSPICDDHEKAAFDKWLTHSKRRAQKLPFETGEFILKNEKAMFIITE